MGMDSGLEDLSFRRNTFIHDGTSFIKDPKFGRPLVKLLSPESPAYLPLDSYLYTPSSSTPSATSLSTISNGFSQEPILGRHSFVELPDVLTVTAPASLSPSEMTNSLEDTKEMLLNYINNMLMDEEIDYRCDIYQEDPALLAAEKPFYEILSENFPTAVHQPPLKSSASGESNEGSVSNMCSRSSSGSIYGTNEPLIENIWSYDPLEYNQLQTNPVSVDVSSQSSFFSPTNGFGNGLAPALSFQKGLEDARKFLPSDAKLVINVERYEFHVPHRQKEGRKAVKVKPENEVTKPSIPPFRGQKNPYADDDLDMHEGRSVKLSALSMEETLEIRNEFDKLLLCNGDETITEIDDLLAELQNEASKSSNSNQSKGSGGGRGRGKKQQPKKEVVDLRTLLIHCAQSVATDDRRSSYELLKQIRKHSSAHGDANQRLAHYFADGLEARLAGTGIQNYRSIVLKEIPITDILKAYKLYMAAFPFKRISFYFANLTILNVAEKAKKLHIIDYGIMYGFQWPCFMQYLARRPGGPPRLRITGIDMPMPGFRPTELIDETGRRLADYAKTFGIQFEYRAIAANWETIKVEDLIVDKDEMVIVNSLYQFKKLVDETVVVDGPRDKVLNNIRELKPALFIHGILNGSYSAPFFLTRFRQALFHFSSCFDMIETNVPREDNLRQRIESYLFGREAINVISCEGAERMERPETFKQWQARNFRSGFIQLPLNPDIVKKARKKIKPYHKDFVLDVDNQWLLQGWKGRILYALSLWKPSP